MVLVQDNYRNCHRYIRESLYKVKFVEFKNWNTRRMPFIKKCFSCKSILTPTGLKVRAAAKKWFEPNNKIIHKAYICCLNLTFPEEYSIYVQFRYLWRLPMVPPPLFLPLLELTLVWSTPRCSQFRGDCCSCPTINTTKVVALIFLHHLIFFLHS